MLRLIEQYSKCVDHNLQEPDDMELDLPLQLAKCIKYGSYIVYEGPPALVWPRITFSDPDFMKDLMTAGFIIDASVFSVCIPI